MSTPTADPTLAFLQKLKDPSKWVVVRNVPIFRACRKKMPSGKIMTVTDADLPRIVNLMREKMENHGVPAVMTIGHRIPKAPQTQQPPIVGYALGAREGVYGPAQKKAVLANLYYKAEDWEEAKKYPFRSVEYYPEAEDVTAVSLLKSDPELDMGVLDFDRVAHFSRSPEIYFFEEVDMPVDPAAPAAPTQKPAAPAGPEGVTPEAHETFMRCMKHHFPKMFGPDGMPAGQEPVEGDEVTGYSADPGAISATNGAMPEPAAKDQHLMARNGQPTQFERAMTAQFNRLGAELKAEREARQAMTTEREKERCEGMILRLERDNGIVLPNRERTLKKLLAMPQAEREEECKELILLQRGPTGNRMVRTQDTDVVSGGGRNDAMDQAVINYMRDNSYELAKKSEDPDKWWAMAEAAVKQTMQR